MAESGADGGVVEVIVADGPDVIVAKQAATQLAHQAGFPARAADEIALAVRELATNVLKFAAPGTITLSWTAGRIVVTARDCGPGIPDVAVAVTDGYSTGGSLGYGLGTVNRLMDEMTIDSSRLGTTITAGRSVRHHQARVGPSSYDVGVASVPKPGYDANGDTFVVKSWDRHILVGVIDGVGHGEPARTAALAARRYVEGHYDQPLEAVFRGTGIACRGTRGVVMALARFDAQRRTIEFGSVGNIESRVLNAPRPLNTVVRRGIIGINAPPPRVTTHEWPRQAILVLHSDGVPVHWGDTSIDDLAEVSSSILAQELLRKLNRGTDDATVLVVRQVLS